MTTHLYLSLTPEALIASMLSPEEFGAYYTVGTTKKQHGEAIFIELDPNFRHDFFRIDEGLARCVPHADGSPKRSVYIATYRVLEHVPIEAMKRLHLVTAYGQTLALEPSSDYPEDNGGLHMYQEIAPVTPLVVSKADPINFYNFLIKDPESMVHIPAVAFVELQLGKLAHNPETGAVEDLPYTNFHHLRECLVAIRTKPIHTKMVNRVQAIEFPYRTIKNGIFIGNADKLVYFPLPSLDELRSKYYRWWQSANATM
ncbi:MAG TPA: hypothetical protein PLD25_23070 [Chloroflexota bacterium]|nr:hypothetical protein [Chloroflexota bacterium]HUM70902.1 hypothetical protein [Chloroflexota bacterium]